jgi:hypothetical protein
MRGNIDPDENKCNRNSPRTLSAPIHTPLMTDGSHAESRRTRRRPSSASSAPSAWDPFFSGSSRIWLQRTREHPAATHEDVIPRKAPRNCGPTQRIPCADRGIQPRLLRCRFSAENVRTRTVRASTKRLAVRRVDSSVGAGVRDEGRVRRGASFGMTVCASPATKSTKSLFSRVRQCRGRPRPFTRRDRRAARRGTGPAPPARGSPGRCAPTSSAVCASR